MYYAAAGLYFVLEPPPGGFDPAQMLASFAFLNAWHPTLMPTVPDRWMVVPGGWSIGVEFSFYLMFPLIVAAIRSIRAALVFVMLALLIGSAANLALLERLETEYGQVAATNFLYFWFPNQLPVFALGTLLCYLLQRLWGVPDGPAARLFRRHAGLIVTACVAAGVVAANLPFPGILLPRPPLVLPALLVASLMFMVVTRALGMAPASPYVNRWIRSLGKVSFSAYLLHFAVLHRLPMLLPRLFDLRASGWLAIATCFGLWLTAVPLTHLFSLATFRAIEDPMIGLGKRVIAAVATSRTSSVPRAA
jgi:peptidoglycan/LPS O-acetylase OafA/YrhL